MSCWWIGCWCDFVEIECYRWDECHPYFDRNHRRRRRSLFLWSPSLVEIGRCFCRSLLSLLIVVVVVHIRPSIVGVVSPLILKY